MGNKLADHIAGGKEQHITQMVHSLQITTISLNEFKSSMALNHQLRKHQIHDKGTFNQGLSSKCRSTSAAIDSPSTSTTVKRNTSDFTNNGFRHAANWEGKQLCHSGKKPTHISKPPSAPNKRELTPAKLPLKKTTTSHSSQTTD
jgi:hypothetical protein